MKLLIIGFAIGIYVTTMIFVHYAHTAPKIEFTNWGKPVLEDLDYPTHPIPSLVQYRTNIENGIVEFRVIRR